MKSMSMIRRPVKLCEKRTSVFLPQVSHFCLSDKITLLTEGTFVCIRTILGYEKLEECYLIKRHITYNHRNDSLVVFEMLSKRLLKLDIKGLRLWEELMRHARRNTNGGSCIPSNASGCPLGGGALMQPVV